MIYYRNFIHYNLTRRLQETTTELKNKTWAALISFLATRDYLEV